MNLADEIRVKFPNYKELAECCFNRSHDLWGKRMYQDNDNFQRLKAEYGIGDNKITKRSQIIELFKQGNNYDGYLCAMVWGNIGSNMRGRQNFNDAFNANQQDIEGKLLRIKELISEDNLEIAFNSMTYGHQNKIPGVNVSFFTKILYFIGEANINHCHPIIFDSVGQKILRRIYNDKNSGLIVKNDARSYLNYVSDMKLIRDELGFQTTGHLEAFLFNCGRCLIEDD